MAGRASVNRGEPPVLLVLGAAGQVGWELLRTLAPLGRVVGPPREEAELEDLDGLRVLLRSLRPAVVVNAAAFTAVDRAEAEPERARLVNATAPGVLAEEARRCGALLVHYSTDYVFDGAKQTPYVESDPPAPLNVYGATKLEGERAVLQAGGEHLVLRTSWVYGLRGHNFLRTMLRLAGEREELRVVDDQWGTPVWSRMIAEATALLCARHLLHGGAAQGLYHLAAGGEPTTWCRFAAAIFEATRGDRPPPRLTAITSDEFPTPAVRPPRSVLSGEKLQRETGIALPGWEVMLRLALAAD